MKKSILSSFIATAIMLFGSTQSLITVSADTHNSNEISNVKGVVTTNKLSNLYALENDDLSQVKNRALSPDSSWVYNKILVGDDGLTYYHVATNEWVSSDAIKSNEVQRPRKKSPIHIGKWTSATVNSKGERTGNILPTYSSWQSFTDTVEINGQKFHQIGTDEFVSAEDLASSQPTYVAPVYTPEPNVNTGLYNGTVIANQKSRIYHLPWQHRYRISPANIVYFPNEAAAIATGYHVSRR